VAWQAEVDVVVNSAANTSFDERLDTSIDVNTLGACRVLHFAKECR
jgi:alcohol-forming fatty acyl-CoA reductase